MQPLRAAIIGCGVIAPTHAKALALDERVRLVLACDPEPGRAEALGAARSARDWQAALAADIDLVVICTPHHCHVEQALTALAAGKHVLVEKPLGTTPAAVAALVEAAARSGRVASGIFQHRFAPLIRRLRELVRGGDFGAITGASLRFRCIRTPAYYASGPWRGRWAGEGGALMINQAIHTVDLLQHLVGPPLAVRGSVARTRLTTIECEDTAQAEVDLRHPGGVVRATLDCANDLEHDWQMRLRIDGTHGQVTLGQAHRLEALTHPSAALQAELRALDQVHLDGCALPGKACYGDHHALQVQDVLGAIRAGRPPLVSVAEAAVTNQLVLALYASAAQGGVRQAVPATSFARPVLAPALAAG